MTNLSPDAPRKIALETLPSQFIIGNRMEIKERIRSHFAAGYDVIVDLAFVEMFDSAGMGALDSLRTEASELGRRIVCMRGNDGVIEMFNLLGRDFLSFLVVDLEAARAYLGGDPPPRTGLPTLSLVT